ncbi:hypothetical protein Mesop_3963 [Mesorhizobium opportunistum WSM2075]|uniref:Uncharacterized protein n=1 Tax=Mesorhizobium opportunistum (strain LMG 24607 / HAMBI 3007 / WSM2075) TaxID=536019 RepID=F7Y3K7_MESOW|nr:hypothetical protein Mesop_3963 [Mesorhizobium opportunistum WSM2075]
MAKGWTCHKPVKPYAEESIGRREVIENGHVVRSLAPVPSPFVMSTLCVAYAATIFAFVVSLAFPVCS